MNMQEDVVIHLTELRKRILAVLGCFLVAMCGGMYLSPHILHFIKSSSSTYEVEWNVFAFTDGLFIYLRCAFLFAVLLTLPLFLYQVWAFVRPGLTEREAKGTLVYVPASFLLFLLGVSFSYFLVFPMMLAFMVKMNHNVGAAETYGIDRYFSFLFSIVFPLGIAFEMPVIILFLTKLGLLSQEKLKVARKYAYVGLAIVGACISPPDFVSHLSVTVPLLALFEISVLLSWRYSKRKDAMPSPT
ncbi:twin-arginine translocase subunit TatC [Paenibacillus sp. HB172176]|uniref:twin-arginine translocase subunit TatC n=1 Tax=Paenibacillus sp. HB172176 TaxID=2493690 RepID=UPI00143896F3|nr:twin-arginine translocase subunit TatC [Paenibacillus sp. HB172176]